VEVDKAAVPAGHGGAIEVEGVAVGLEVTADDEEVEI
jgi:hypothetical protein